MDGPESGATISNSPLSPNLEAHMAVPSTICASKFPLTPATKSRTMPTFPPCKCTQQRIPA